MPLNDQGRQTRPTAAAASPPSVTLSGHRGLEHEEPLIFESGDPARSGVDLPTPNGAAPRLGGVKERQKIGLPGLSEPETVRHYTRLSRKNYAIDMGLYPLGSCTMKHNPRLNEAIARLPGFAHAHPLQPRSTAPGAIQLMGELAYWLKTLTGMAEVALSPGAGAHGEFCGMAAILAALEDQGETGRRRVLVPDSAHGTNPATAASLGFTVDPIPNTARGRVDPEEVRQRLGDDLAGIMITNPNTCGLFEPDLKVISGLIHGAGGYVYCDGANFNAIVGKVRPADLGVDAMHINLHKTFSTPHGGGGPGAGPVVFSEALAPYAPLPLLIEAEGGYRLCETEAELPAGRKPFGRIKAYHGQMGMFTRALSYMMSHGGDGLKQVAEDAVLNANYVMARLGEVMSASFEGPCMHECLFDDRFLKGSGVETLDIAKAMLDEGYHPMTMYFPLVVHGAMLIEPTETESKESLDRFITVMRGLAARAAADPGSLKAAPQLTPRKRLDETAAARKPRLRWTPPDPSSLAAE